MPWLREQFKLLQPKIVVCLGRIGRLSAYDPHRFLRDQGARHLVQKNGVWFMGTSTPPPCSGRRRNKNPAAFADFRFLRDK